jgi:UDP:flavonoid glycosyltransferase YjiC (YdhE family)
VKRVLFVAEAVSLAQVVRLVTLAQSLEASRYEVHFASARFDDLIFRGTTFTRHTLSSLSPEVVERRVARGLRPYGRRTLARYVRDDLALFERVRPDLVVGDLRLSLAVSAPLSRVPLASVINAYWSPYAERDGWPLPDHPIVRLLGVRLASEHFPKALPMVFRHFAAPVNALRRAHGLPEVGDLPEALTFGDYTLYADAPALVPTRALPESHVFLGHVPWSPAVALPATWARLDPTRPSVYVTLGSTGRADRLPLVVEAALDLGCDVLVATAGRTQIPVGSPRLHVADYVPGHLAARRAAVVVSNGGSTTGYQALAEGRPVLGVPCNLDQYLATKAIERYGAGLGLRSGTVTSGEVGAALERLLGDSSFAARARLAQRELTRCDARTRFPAFVESVVPSGVAPRVRRLLS